MKTAPLPPATAMQCIAKNGNYSLFDRGGKPEVLKRYISEKKGDATAQCLVEERGDLNGKHLTDHVRRVFTEAWQEYVSWKTANQ